MSFREVTLRNFRAWEQLTLQLRPITLLFGPNNSGKSSILSALALLAQTAESADQEVPLLLNGQYADLGTYRDVVFNNDRRHVITIGFSLDSGQETGISASRLKGYFPVEKLATYCMDGGELAEHPPAKLLAGVEAATGSLGHGLPIGCGMAMAGRILGLQYRVFALLSDGECN